MNSDDKNRKRLFGFNVEDRRHQFLLVGSIVGIWFLSLLIIIVFTKLPGGPGEVGDLFGAVNALFSGLAFAGIIFTILLQREELEAQRNELKLTRREFRKQNQTFKIQRFENTFFNIYKVHLDTVASFEIDNRSDKSQLNNVRPDSELFKGKQIFFFLNRYLAGVLKESEASGSLESLDVFSRAFEPFYEKYEGQLTRYIDSLLCVFEYIFDSDLIDDDLKAQYFKIVHYHLTLNERTILFYYSLLAPRYPRTIRLWQLMFCKYMVIDDPEVHYRPSHGILVSLVFEKVKIAKQESFL